MGIDETPSTRTAATAPAALLDDLEITAQRNLALARLNSSPLPPIQTNHMNNPGNNSVTNGPNNVGPNNTTEQSLYSHLYGKEMGLMRKLSNIDEYPNHAARSYQQLLQHSDGILPPGAAHPMQQNFAGHPHAAKFNQFNYPNPGGLLKPCYDYASQQQQAAAVVAQQHQLQSHQNTASGTTSNATPTSNQQMKKEMFNLSGSNGADLYTPPPSTSSGSVASQGSTGANAATNTTASMANGSAGNGSLAFMNLHQSSSAAAAAVAAAMYANHFNTNGTGGSGGLPKMDNGDSLADFNPMRNVGSAGNPMSNGPPNNGSNNLIKSADSVLMARSSIMNNLNNNLNKIEPNTDTTLNDNNNNPHNHHHQQQGHNHLGSHQQHHGGGGGGGHHPFHHQMSSLAGGNGGVATGPGNNDDDNDKLSSPLTGTSSLTNTDLNDPDNEGNDDGYTIL
ncbi:putative uncharacterized protein DDB_G0286901 [Armigeres subalbatus]|uniref:putative uncharacterized protein DDB_G0286901 n=1 Tax=Armigeres subalbatus TaxID=124917 RepID=UPI002ED5B93E